MFVHLAVYTDETYKEEAVRKRSSWAKYPCAVERQRLRRLSSGGVGPIDVRGYAVKRLANLRAGETAMEEILLPSFASVTHRYGSDRPEFTEFCHAVVATAARLYARALGKVEADLLGNDAFFPWYDEVLLSSTSLLPLMGLKSLARSDGLSQASGQSVDLAVGFLETLLSRLDKDGL